MAGFTHFGKIGVLGKQAVAGVNRIHVGNFGRTYHCRNIKIALGKLRRPNADRFIGKTNVQRIPVSVAVNGDRADAKLLAGTNDPQCNFASIGNQDLFEHEYSAWSLLEDQASGSPRDRRSDLRKPPNATTVNPGQTIKVRKKPKAPPDFVAARRTDNSGWCK